MLFIASLIVFVALQLADIWTTGEGLEKGLQEGNPVIRTLMDTLGEAWPLAKATVAVLAVVLLIIGGVPGLIWVVNAFYVFIVWRNWKLIR